MKAKVYTENLQVSVLNCAKIFFQAPEPQITHSRCADCEKFLSEFSRQMISWNCREVRCRVRKHAAHITSYSTFFEINFRIYHPIFNKIATFSSIFSVFSLKISENLVK